MHSPQTPPRTQPPLLRACLALAAAALLSGTASCSNESAPEAPSDVTLYGSALLDPVPSDPGSLAAQLKRFAGQTAFLSPTRTWWWGGTPDYAAAAGERPIQEADIFKVGKPGSKLLYLLNNYRGLQVVDFTAGPEAPRLAGRVAATGNWPETMYFDADHDRLVVVERVYFDEEGDYVNWSEVQSRIVVYDVKDPARPRVSQTVPVKGEFTESRLVGSVLYVATALRPSYADRMAGKKGAGFVLSFDLGETVTAVDTHELALPTSSRENMSVIETRSGDDIRYYLVAVLSESGWGWWDQQSSVEVVDISSAEGDIKPLLVVSARGFVNERSQTTVKDGVLIVTSNFTVGDGDIAHVAVEAFQLPATGADEQGALEADEAEYRRQWLARELRASREALIASGLTGAALEAALATRKAELLADPELGLAGRFVKDGGTLRKPVADGSAEIADPDGQSANLQDVRYDGDLMYVFWVPANNIDPLDVFDVSQPSRPTHVAHLTFDGWIQRALPVTREGRHYLLGLGWVVEPDPADPAAPGRRFPQAALFEITGVGAAATTVGGVQATQVARLSLGDSHSWASFNADDRDVEFRLNDDGTGSILFLFSSWSDGRYRSGGKLLGFDLSGAAITAGRALREGGLLTAPRGWLRRVFTNPEIDRVNSFSDAALGTYQLAAGIGAPETVLEAAHVLELARSIQAFVPLDGGAGLQVISDGAWSYGNDATTQLRLVRSAAADTEGRDVLASLDLQGWYVDHFVKGTRLFIMTRRDLDPTGDAAAPDWRLHVTAVATEGGRLAPAGDVSWSGHYPDLDRFTNGFVELGDSVYAVAGAVYLLQPGRGAAPSGLVATPASLANCDLTHDSMTFTNVSGRIVLQYAVDVVDPDHSGLTFIRRFAAPLAASDAGDLTCGTALNVPGEVKAFLGSHLVTQDERLVDIVSSGSGQETYERVVSEPVLTALAWTTTTATLTDLYDPDGVGFDSMRLLPGDRLAFLESKAFQRYPWVFDSAYPSYPSSEEQLRLSVLRVDDAGRFTKSSWDLDISAPAGASLLAAFPGEHGLVYGVVNRGRSVSVLKIAADDDTRPRFVSLSLLDARFEPGPASTQVVLHSYWGPWARAAQDAVAFVPGDAAGRDSLTFAEGWTGISQVLLEE